MGDTSWAVAKLLRKLTRRPAAQAVDAGRLRCAIERTGDGSPDTSWAAHLDAAIGKYYRPTVTLTGPGQNDLVRWVCEMLADSIHDGDERAKAWSDYVIAVGNLKAADDATTPDREVDVADAWSALEAELPNTVRLPLMEALSLGRLLEQTAGGALAEIGRTV